MSTRPLRTQSVAKPRTQGERIRVARIAANLSQPQLARAVSQITKTKVSKSLVSQWERDDVANPNNASMLAIQSVTGFAMEWLVSGRGPQRYSLAPVGEAVRGLNQELLSRAFMAVCPEVDKPETKAKVIGALYDLLAEAPDTADSALQRLAATLLKT